MSLQMYINIDRAYYLLILMSVTRDNILSTMLRKLYINKFESSIRFKYPIRV